MRLYHEEDGIQVWHGDCREVLPTLSDGAAGVVITDPPFNVGVDYGSHDDRQDPAAYRAWLAGVLRECSRVARESVVYFPGVVNVWDVPDVLRLASIRPRRLLGWHRKEFAGDTNVGGPCISWEPIVWASNRERPYYSRCFGVKGRDFLVVPYVRGDPFKGPHPCPKPMPVLHWLVGLFAPDGLPVLDPFAGTGTTLRAAKDAGLPAIGIEVEERFCELTVKRLSQKVFAWS